MQYAGIPLPVSPGGHFGGGTAATIELEVVSVDVVVTVVLVVVDVDDDAVLFASWLSQAQRAKTVARERRKERMGVQRVRRFSLAGTA